MALTPSELRRRKMNLLMAMSYAAFASTKASTWSPTLLFAAGEQGAWYDPSDLSTMFQDSAGTTPVTAVEQPVGLILDKSKGGRQSLAVTGWTKDSGDGTVTVDGGTITITGATTTTRVDITAPGWALGNYADITVTGSVAGATGAALYVGGGGVYTTLSGTNTFRNVIVSSTLLRLQIATGSATYVVTSRGFVPGNHASQSTSASRPVRSARGNLLTYSEDFSQAIWNKINSTASAMNVADPIGGNTASTITATAASGFFFHNASSSTSTVSNSIWVRRRTGTGAIRFRTAAGGIDTDYSSSITSSWSLLTWQCTPTGSSNTYVISIATSGDAIDLWHPDCRVTNVGVGLPAYQRVGAAVPGTTNPPVTGVPDYDTSGFPLYLKFDGVDDSLATGTIDFSATDKMSVFAGVRKLSDSSGHLIAELGNVSFGGWYLLPGNYVAGTGSVFTFLGHGTASENVNQAVQATGYASPLTAVLAATGNIIGDTNTLRVNSVAATNATGDQGTGNFGNLPLNIGRRNNTSLPFNGNLYSLIVRGALSTDAQIASTETWVNGKTKAY